MIFCHFFHPVIEGFYIYIRTQTNVLKVGVASIPRVVYLLGCPSRRQGDDSFGVDGSIIWQVGIRTAYSQIAFVIVADDLTDGVFTAEHPLCQTLTQINDIGLLKVLHGIAAQHFDTHRLEEERIGAQLGFVETGITVIQRPRSQIAVGAGGRFYFFRKVFQNGTCQRPHVHVLGFILFTVHDELAPHLIKPVVVAEACVITLLVGHTGKKQDAHGKSQTQGNDLEEDTPLPSEQSLDDVIDLFHCITSFFDCFLPISMQKSCQSSNLADNQQISIF